MKKIFAEELEKQQQNLLKLISGTFKITVQEIEKYWKWSECIKKKHRICRGGSSKKVQNMQRKVSSL